MPPSDHVLDTNVLLVASAADPGSPFKDAEHLPAAEQRRVLHWLSTFRQDSARLLVLDSQKAIMAEYKKKLAKSDYGYRLIMEKLVSARFRFHPIQIDADGSAVLPEPLKCHVKDLADRKFVAVALQDRGRCTLVNACDTDWCDCEHVLREAGIEVTQLLESWCRAKHAERNRK